MSPWLTSIRAGVNAYRRAVTVISRTADASSSVSKTSGVPATRAPEIDSVVVDSRPMMVMSRRRMVIVPPHQAAHASDGRLA
jgi:hypothetical protein